MSTITKERIELFIKNPLENGLTRSEQMEVARIALASLEAKPIGAFHIADQRVDGTSDYIKDGEWPIDDGVIEVYAAPPAPVSVPYLLEQFAEFMAAESIKSGDYPDGWQCKASNAAHEYAQNIRAAMLQGADRPQNETQNIPENIPATQFKPVADLYGLTSPTGSETSFTFDAVEARDFIGGGWSCQEYVELERFQEAVSGNSPVIPDGWQLVPKKITLEMECALSRADSYEIGWRWALAAAPTHSGTNDGWVACSERMPGMGVDVLACTISPIGGFEEIETAQWHGGMKGEQPVFITSADAIEPTHWMPLPAAPKQELK